MNFIFPMAGLSSRFKEAGFTLPKYMLYLKDKSVFNRCLSGFSKYFRNSNFIFIAKDIFDTQKFIEEECKVLNIQNFEIIILNHHTNGQAETVMQGIEKSKLLTLNQLVIFNIDTFRTNFCFPHYCEKYDGYIEVFIGNGNNWSYAATLSPESTRVASTAEKKQISNYCSTGLYYFKNAKLFEIGFNEFYTKNSFNYTEKYIAPLYNSLITLGYEIHINKIDINLVQFCGIPDEFFHCLKMEVNQT